MKFLSTAFFLLALAAFSGCGGVLAKADRSSAVKRVPAAFSVVEPTIPVFRGE